MGAKRGKMELADTHSVNFIDIAIFVGERDENNQKCADEWPS
jgi:hypothetical protein